MALPSDPNKLILTDADITRAGALKAALDGAKATQNHAAQHAAGGPDPVTPASIGALSFNTGVYTGHADDLVTPGTYYVSGTMTLENGWADQPNRWGNAFVTTASGRVLQLTTSNAGEVAHMRYKGTGNLWGPWLRLDNGGIDARFRSGTGSPEGVLAAPVGTEYTDTAGTNGAWKWLKTAGTGTTGWTVTFQA